ncbi:methylated-DNA--[protein]-cysteine S-methyltransferase [Oceanicola sp. S124]|uniref:methylated-DNA--[protein]-cysteine S-methyltransferase n=1 Tax=Oceanicola sp. S124 TaxID=1042378 RepID=UPI000255A9B7|nr:methylated-DNA--[protein]-cysteine S-methyltransferase [Oceanicola sp. S124]
MPCMSLDTPTGRFWLLEDNGAITRASWRDLGPEAPTELLRRGIDQLAEYFDGRRRSFDLPLRIAGGDFQRRICTEIAAIPFGETRTYGDLARTLSAPAQAVGQGCGGNPIPVIVPCHRILAATGLGGFSGEGGVETKVWLLKHEGAASLLI